jgi:CHASE2 domain-containing sensor protein
MTESGEIVVDVAQTGVAARATTLNLEDETMALVVILLILALIFGGVGLFLEAAWWALIIALVLLVVGAVMGFAGRRGSAV